MRWLLAILLVAVVLAAGATQSQAETTAIYQIQVRDPASHRVAVRATVPGNTTELRMDTSRPGDIPEVADAGWPALVQRLRVRDAAGNSVGVTANGARGWVLARRADGPLTLEYLVDYTPLAARDWPAPREAAFADARHMVVIGRSLFITTPAQGVSEVSFVLPRDWQPVVPWPALRGARRSVSVAAAEDLTENLVAFVKGAPDVLTAGGFNLKVIALGHWESARGEVLRVLGVVAERLVGFIGFSGPGDYLVVLLPLEERGGESFRASFAMSYHDTPARANLGDWGNTIAHEVFHYWNAWRLRGADYASSQWFQEGFTEYAANLALVSGGLTTDEMFYAKLATHVTQYRELATPLDAPGTRKGPPLYSGGALVAFLWDIEIRGATGGREGVGDLLRVMLRNTDGGARPYAWEDIRVALGSLAPGDWDAFYRRHIHGTEPLPLEAAFARVGLRMAQRADGTIAVEVDPKAMDNTRQLRSAVMQASR
ncbi:MAG: hypothetical protein OEX18_13865 [Candidatus Krumholzibacteria bacterium]|nr:hypothetical protein [Candidatus Krumholzibacteria bacterium]MDH4338354.1 hypothetical protein [Candidatus Krumholzibacteria bacterium]MDH5269804.1 hypothetical protein [Candidatus Krumholzibacteria bacterium]